jgi:hypothetical protein
MARHLPPDHSLGDESTLGGYAAVHARPAAFEGSDGMSYSVAPSTDETGDVARPWGGYLLFLRWRSHGEQGVEGHLETEFLTYGATEVEARSALERLPLVEVARVLEAAIWGGRGSPSARPWWDAMREEE